MKPSVHVNYIQMKRLLYISILALAVFISPSCNKKLDVQPQNSVTGDQINSSEGVIALLNGGYSQFQSYNAFGEQFMLIPDLMANTDQVDWIGTYSSYRNIARNAIIATNSVASGIWGNAYKIIGIANTVIDKISLVDSADKDLVLAQAYFLRGTAYFYLVGLFAKPYSDGNASTNLGVPIVLQPTYVYDTLKDKPARATVQATYDQILSDLKAAEATLPETNGTNATLYTAKGMLARVYMSMLDYNNAATEADDIISSGNYNLMTSYNLAFNNDNNSMEDIFAIQETNQSNAGTSNQGITTFYCPTYGLPSGQTTGRGDAQADPNYFAYFETLDYRANFFLDGTSIAGYSGSYPIKWQKFYKAIPVMRLAEMYLTRGEANLMAGTTVGASPDEDINTVRTRSGASVISGTTIQDFVDERFRELGFEGDRFWTLKRNKLDIGAYGYDDNKKILPIPQAEIDVDANLKQNDGY